MKADAAVARRFLFAGGTVLPIGIAIAATGERFIGSLITLTAAAVVIAGLHTFGRAGPDFGDSEADASPTRDER